MTLKNFIKRLSISEAAKRFSGHNFIETPNQSLSFSQIHSLCEKANSQLSKDAKNKRILIKADFSLGSILKILSAFEYSYEIALLHHRWTETEIQKQIKGMPGQEKMILDYYQKNPSASQNLKGALYEEKILNLFKTKIKLTEKEISTVEAEKIIANFNKSSQIQASQSGKEEN